MSEAADNQDEVVQAEAVYRSARQLTSGDWVCTFEVEPYYSHLIFARVGPAAGAPLGIAPVPDPEDAASADPHLMPGRAVRGSFHDLSTMQDGTVKVRVMIERGDLQNAFWVLGPVDGCPQPNMKVVLVHLNTPLDQPAPSKPQAAPEPSAAADSPPVAGPADTAGERIRGGDNDPPNTETPAPKNNGRAYGQDAAALMRSPFVRRPDVWRALGGDQAYREWLSSQPSALSNTYGPDGTTVAVTRSGNSDFHAEFSALPLTPAEDERRERDGADALIPADRWKQLAMRHLQTWAKESLKRQLGYASLGDVPPDVLFKWAERRGLERALPPTYRNDRAQAA